MGECRQYNTISTQEEHLPKPTEPMPKPINQEKPTESSTKPPSITPEATTKKQSIVVEEHPLELEAVLSSTVNEKDEKVTDDNKSESITPEQKVKACWLNRNIFNSFPNIMTSQN